MRYNCKFDCESAAMKLGLSGFCSVLSGVFFILTDDGNDIGEWIKNKLFLLGIIAGTGALGFGTAGIVSGCICAVNKKDNNEERQNLLVIREGNNTSNSENSSVDNGQCLVVAVAQEVSNYNQMQ